MAVRKYRGNLSAAEYPLNPVLMGASVIVAGPDQTLSRYVDSSESRDPSIGIPQVYYAKNVLPTKEGLSSLSYIEQSPNTWALSGAADASVFDRTGDKMYVRYGIEQIGASSVYRRVLLTYDTEFWWGSSTIASDIGLPTAEDIDTQLTLRISSCQVQGASYVFIESIGLILRDPTTGVYFPVSMTGLELSTIKGVTGVSGYLLAYSDTAIAWSTTLQLLPSDVARSTAYVVGDTVRPPAHDTAHQWRCTTAGTTDAVQPTYTATVGVSTTDGTAVFICEALSVDFEPSLITGAGGGELEELDGHIVTVLPSLTGFIAYTTANMVAGIYTGNAQYPFTFKAIPNGAGIIKQTDVTESAAAGMHYALTRFGLMQVATTSAKLIEPGVSDWLSNATAFSVGIDGVPTFARTQYTYTRLAFVSGRYLCVSRGTTHNRFSEALIYDTALQRYGQITYEHASITSLLFVRDPAGPTVDTARLTFVAAQNAMITMRPVVVGFAMETLLPATVILGRYRYIREQLLRLLSVTVGACFTFGNGQAGLTSAYLLYTLDDKSKYRSTGALTPRARADTAGAVVSTSDMMHGARTSWYSNITAEEFSVMLVGSFALNTIELEFTSGGHR